ncbi:aromatic acid exporter family protein [Paenibacillus hodogayensis]|uniref:Aromatic acid exporter family protein n=1 Tax=Paenibacillus hodogayensis TaxID=279208 RepID=A0ABV5W358_9BACL
MGIRTLKTAIATVAAVYLAMLLSVQYPMSAGLLAIMGVESTIRKGIVTSLTRIGASVMGLAIATIMLVLFGFHLYVLAAFILIAIPVLLKLRLQNGLATCCVTVFHIFSVGQATVPIVLNELALLGIGLGTATIVNVIYMPDTERKLKRQRERVEHLFSVIFIQLARHLRDVDYVWSGSEVLEAHEAIERGKQEAVRAAENRLFAGDPYWNGYFRMRDSQLESIQDMIHIVAQVYSNLPHGQLVAELFEELSVDVKSDTYTGNVESRLSALEAGFRDMSLPQTREEFEVRSAILQMCHELTYYLNIAKREKKQSTSRQ